MATLTQDVKITDGAGNELGGVAGVQIDLRVGDIVRAKLDIHLGYLDLPCLATWHPLYPHNHGESSRRLSAVTTANGDRIEMATIVQLEFDDGIKLDLPEEVYVRSPEVDAENLSRMIEIRAATERAAGRPEPQPVHRREYVLPKSIAWGHMESAEVWPGEFAEIDGRRFECVEVDDENARFVER